MRARKGMEFNIVVGLIIALVAVGLFLALMGGGLRKSMSSIYCNTIIGLTVDESDPTYPEMCKGSVQLASRMMENTEKKLASRELLSYIIACWQKSDSLEIKEEYVCYELGLPQVMETVTEADVSEILVKEDRCRSIENSDYGCGVLDQILWEVEGGAISGQRIIFIEYVPNPEAVRVVG
ncbi:MAG: hypothetical protein ACP5E4_00195 [Candidatus Aenigmatarchaeota archaeon]